MPHAQDVTFLRRPELHLADRLFLAAHSPVSAELQVSKEVLARGLGGAMVAELALIRRLKINTENRAVVLVEHPDPKAPEPDYVGKALLADIRRSPDTTDVRLWLAYLATPNAKGDMAYTWIGDRLTSKGILTCELRRRWFTKVKSYYPTDYKAQLANTRLAGRIATDEALGYPQLLLAGLIFAVGLDDAAFKDVADDRKVRLRNLIDNSLPPSLRCIVTEVEAIVGDLVMKSHY